MDKSIEYQMSKRLDCRNLKKCLEQYGKSVEKIIIKAVNMSTPKVEENLEGKTLEIERYNSGIRVMAGNSEIFQFLLKKYLRGFSIKHEDGKSVLYNCIDNHNIEVYFKVDIPVEFYKWNKNNTQKYWNIV